MLRALSVLFCAVLIGAAAGCSRSAEEQAPAPEAIEAVGSVSSAGEVVAVTREYNAVTIRHEAIPEYGMGAMTMEFTVADPSLLADVDVGDRVTFELSGPIDISAMTVTEGE